MTPIDSGHLIHFVRSALDEDAAVAREWQRDDLGADDTRFGASRMLADVAAKRRIVDWCEAALDVQEIADLGGRDLALLVLREMATGLAGRDGFEEGWRVQ